VVVETAEQKVPKKLAGKDDVLDALVLGVAV
jgi:hypothetical protein